MAVNVSEYVTKFQQEGLAAIKETQDASLKAMNSFREFTKEMTEKPGTVPAFENIPTPLRSLSTFMDRWCPISTFLMTIFSLARTRAIFTRGDGIENSTR